MVSNFDHHDSFSDIKKPDLVGGAPSIPFAFLALYFPYFNEHPHIFSLQLI